MRAGRHALVSLVVAAASLAAAGCGGGSGAPASTASIAFPEASSAEPAAAVTSSTTTEPARPPFRSSARLIEHGPRTKKRVALTFDADMTQEMLAELKAGTQKTWIDHKLFDLLRDTKTPATIFLTGLWTERYPSFVRRLAHDPLIELENHSYDHAAWTDDCYGLPAVDTPAEKRHEVVDTLNAIARVTGAQTRYFRFPGGCEDAAGRRIVARTGEDPLQWDVVSGDPGQPNPAPIVTQVLDGVKPGSIVIAHCIGAPNAPATAAAMAQIIPGLKAKGYRFVTVQELLDG